MDKDKDYNLWKFFKDEHELILLDGQLTDIVMAVEKYEPKVKWVSISEQMPPLHNYVLLVNEIGYMKVDFIHEYDLTTQKYQKNYTHWANLPEKPNK